MKNNYILIDYENVQPKSLALLDGHPFKVLVFVGANQAKIPIDLASALQALGDSAEYIRIGGNGPNALDFHIAFYIGRLAERDSNACFHIISRDAGFDPLIKHLKERSVTVQREPDLAEIPLLRISNATSPEDKVAAIVKNLKGRGQARPRKLKTLRNTINSLFMKTLDQGELTALVEELQKRRHVVIEGERVGYRPPISHS
ncbi:MAG: PIN domain-containing protein [Chromatiales bacterium]